MIFSVKDSLRQAVEAASGGLATVMYTRKGQPVFLRRIPRFNLEQLGPQFGSGPHPAFVVNGETKSEIWVSMYRAVLSNGELVSVPGQNASLLTYDQAVAYAAANGPGFHLMTRAEFMAVVLPEWLKAGKTDPPIRGNTQWGRSHEAPYEWGVRVDGQAPGTTTGDNATLAGSGPLAWRHDGTPFGVADIFGSRFLWFGGLRVNYGRIEIIPDASLDLSLASPNWMAIRASDGAPVTPQSGQTGVLYYKKDPTKSFTDDGVSQNVGPAILGTSPDTFPSGWDENTTTQDYVTNSSMSLAYESGLTPPTIAYALGLVPIPGVTKGAFLDYVQLAGKNPAQNRARPDWSSNVVFGLGFSHSPSNAFVVWAL